VGGMAIPVDPNSQNALNAGSIAMMMGSHRSKGFRIEYTSLTPRHRSFYKDWAAMVAESVIIFLREYQNSNEPNTTRPGSRGDYIREITVLPVITEDAKKYPVHWYKYKGGDENASPVGWRDRA